MSHKRPISILINKQEKGRKYYNDVKNEQKVRYLMNISFLTLLKTMYIDRRIIL